VKKKGAAKETAAIPDSSLPSALLSEQVLIINAKGYQIA